MAGLAENRTYFMLADRQVGQIHDMENILAFQVECNPYFFENDIVR